MQPVMPEGEPYILSPKLRVFLGFLLSIIPLLAIIGAVSIPFQLRYWPEFVVLFLLLLIITTIISSHWRTRQRLAFHRWWTIHRWAAVFETRFSIDRLDYGVGTGKFFEMGVVGNKVDILITLELLKD